MKITITNNFCYIRQNQYSFWWAPDDWFPLNKTTRALFKKDILPLIKTGECNISTEDYTTIKEFIQNPENLVYPTTIIQPNGIILQDHQLTAVDYMLRYNKFGFFLGTGTGKTLIAITWLLNIKPKSCLIVTPQKVVSQYKQELDKYIVGNNYQVTNFEQLKKFTDQSFEALIIDESHRAKNYMSLINKNLREIAQHSKYIYLFTGTPQDKHRYEILSQLAILDARVMPVKTKIINRYFNLDDYFNPKTEKREFSGELTALINAYTWGKQTEEVINVTEEHNFIVKCNHPTKYYDSLLQNRVIQQGMNACVADTPTKLRIYLREISAGYVNWKTVDNQDVIQHIQTDKVQKLTACAKRVDTGIIYYEFTESIKEITIALQTIHKTYVIVNGNTGIKETQSNLEKFKTNQVDFLIIQSKSGNAGLDLTNVNNIIFYSLPESYIIFHQCKSRIRRIGQTKECNYYYLICENTIEELIFKSLRKKKSFTDRIFKQYI